MLSSMCSSYGFVYLLEPTFSVKQPRHKQLFSDVMHLNQRGLAILLRRIISFLPRSQRQLPHTKLTRQQRPGGDNVKSACDAAVRKLESVSRRTQDPHKDSHKVNYKEMATSHISLTTVSIPTARNRPLAQLLSTGDTQAAHHCRTVVLL